MKICFLLLKLSHPPTTPTRPPHTPPPPVPLFCGRRLSAPVGVRPLQHVPSSWRRLRRQPKRSARAAVGGGAEVCSAARPQRRSLRRVAVGARVGEAVCGGAGGGAGVSPAAAALWDDVLLLWFLPAAAV